MIDNLSPPEKDTTSSCIFDFPDRPTRPVRPDPPGGGEPDIYPYDPVDDWPPIIISPDPHEEDDDGSGNTGAIHQMHFALEGNVLAPMFPSMIGGMSHPIDLILYRQVGFDGVAYIGQRVKTWAIDAVLVGGDHYEANLPYEVGSGLPHVNATYRSELAAGNHYFWFAATSWLAFNGVSPASIAENVGAVNMVPASTYDWVTSGPVDQLHMPIGSPQNGRRFQVVFSSDTTLGLLTNGANISR